MNNNIKILIEKYFAGESNLKEEAIIKAYFKHENIAPEFQEYSALFQHFESEKEAVLTEDFDAKLFEAIEQSTKPQLKIAHQNTSTKKLYTAVRFLSRIAAVLVIGLAVWWMYPPKEEIHQPTAIDWSKYEVKTAEEAFKATQLAFSKISGEMHKGASKVANNISKTRVNWKVILE